MSRDLLSFKYIIRTKSLNVITSYALSATIDYIASNNQWSLCLQKLNAPHYSSVVTKPSVFMEADD